VAGIYIHIPFCKQACFYCDFHFSTDFRHQDEMVHAMIKEISMQKDFLHEPVQTLYLGGGTPSTLTETHMAHLLDAIHRTFVLDPSVEVTLEGNPDDLTPAKLRHLKALGFNRLSIGIQSFDDIMLRYLNRAHDAHAGHQCLQAAMDIGFTNFSLDLIYAIPGLGIDQWEETLAQAIRYRPTHLSSYMLTIEEKTVFGNWKKKGTLTMVDEEMAAKQFELLQSAMESAGYQHYEISNFCKPGFHSRHNSSYWMQTPYLGIGPSAHSYDGNIRYFNVRNNAGYVRSIGEGSIPSESEVLTSQNKINEYILTRLRTIWGCDLNHLKRDLGDNLIDRRGAYIEDQINAGFLLLEDGVLRLTRRGKLLADKITEDLMV
jgi:oxygen-independent coproporphyrinogen-3 oxidase